MRVGPYPCLVSAHHRKLIEIVLHASVKDESCVELLARKDCATELSYSIGVLIFLSTDYLREKIRFEISLYQSKLEELKRCDYEEII
jgi:hypothetical protein